MTNIKIKGQIKVPGDKSISHRSIMLGALSKGQTCIHGFLKGADCLSTISCFRKMGVNIVESPDEIVINGNGLNSLKPSQDILDVGNSGTTIRLLSGILAGQSFQSEITGDLSIQKRPMKRVISPLRLMGCDIFSKNNNDCAPLVINGGSLQGITYNSPISSAQVKSCLLFAGLYADSPTSVIEPTLSRNHTEIMLKYFGADITTESNKTTIRPSCNLTARTINIPSDISSAAYFIAAALLIPGSELLIKSVGTNPTRDGILEVASNMGANIEYINKTNFSGEEVCDILVRSSKLHATNISGEIIPRLIDEIPIIAVMAAFAEGTTIIKDAAELKVKESDRITLMTHNLKNMGVDITATEDGMIINGSAKNLKKAPIIMCQGDHRIAMSMTICYLAAGLEPNLDDENCIFVSYPGFFDDLKSVIK